MALGRLAAGQTVLLPAASSSVGLAAIRISKRVGARPIALTRTSSKADELRVHGAAAIVVTEEQDLVSEIKRFTDGKGAELVFDPVGGPTFAKLVEATSSGGLLILYGALSRDPTVVPPSTSSPAISKSGASLFLPLLRTIRNSPHSNAS
jgi:NADPH:quinone reductase-like Zn-dependent oxidoreductase